MICNARRTTAPCLSSVCSFTALVLQETTLCVNQFTADDKQARSSCNISFCSTTEHYIHSIQKANFSIHIITGDHLAPQPLSYGKQVMSLLCGMSCSYLEKRHLAGLLNEKMQFINLLAN